MKWRVTWTQDDDTRMAVERATREEAVPIRNECQQKYSEVELRVVKNNNPIQTEPFKACHHPGGNIQQWTELCLTCGDNIYDDHIDPGPTIPFDQFLITYKKVVFSFEEKPYTFIQYVEEGRWRAQGWSRQQKWIDITSDSNQDIGAEYFKVFYLEGKEI